MIKQGLTLGFRAQGREDSVLFRFVSESQIRRDANR